MKKVNVKRLSLILILSLFTAIFMMVSCSDETAETSVNENNPVEAPEKPKAEPKDEEPNVASPGEIPEIVTPGEITEPEKPEELPEEELPEVSTPGEMTESEEKPIAPSTETPEEPKVEPKPIDPPKEEPEVKPISPAPTEEPKPIEPPKEEPKVEEPKSKIISSGKCDDNITWTLDENGTLIVSGTGAIYVSNRYNYLDDKWFDNADKAKKVIVQEGITSLGMDSFQAFTKMTSITLPSTLIHIGYGAFGTCESLTSITIPDSVTSIGDWSFCGCTSLTSIHLPDKATDIYEATFQGCTNLKSVTLPKGITKIPREFFGGCTSLESITIPDGVTTIDWWAFSGCTNLSEITIPASVTNVCDSAFSYWTNAQNIYIKGSTDGWDKNWNRDCNAQIHYPKNDVEEKPVIKYEGVMTYAEYAAAKLDTPVVVETYVQATQSWWDNQISVYTQSPEGAYFIYNLACSEEESKKLVKGTKIRVSGTKGEWAGLVEILDAEFEILEGNWIAEATDVTSLLGTKEIINHQNEFVSFKGMTFENKNFSGNGDIFVDLSYNGTTYSFCIEYFLTGPDTEVYQTVKSLKKGDKIDVEGFLYWYVDINPHITSIKVLP